MHIYLSLFVIFPVHGSLFFAVDHADSLHMHQTKRKSNCQRHHGWTFIIGQWATRVVDTTWVCVASTILAIFQPHLASFPTNFSSFKLNIPRSIHPYPSFSVNRNFSSEILLRNCGFPTKWRRFSRYGSQILNQSFTTFDLIYIYCIIFITMKNTMVWNGHALLARKLRHCLTGVPT